MTLPGKPTLRGGAGDQPAWVEALGEALAEALKELHRILSQIDREYGHRVFHEALRFGSVLAGAGEDDWTMSFQSRVGREEWLKPYTDETVKELGQRGVGRLDVICPGFSADCLETLEEIAMQNAEFFTEAGGGSLHYIPALNARDDHVAALTTLIERHTRGWPGS